MLFCVCLFTLALVHTTFHLFNLTFHVPHGSVIAGFWIVSRMGNLCDRCLGSHFVISRLLAGGSLGFRTVLCCFSCSQIAVWLFRGLCLRFRCLPYLSIGDISSLPIRFTFNELTS